MTPKRHLPRELLATLEALWSLEHRSRQLADELEDVYVLAYDRAVTGEGGGRASRQAWYLDEQGLAKAKALLRELADRHTGVPALDRRLTALHGDVARLFAGPPADPTLRGTLLGEVDPTTGQVVPGSAKREFDEALRARRRRAGRGEYQPSGTEPQPGFRWRE